MGELSEELDTMSVAYRTTELTMGNPPIDHCLWLLQK